MSGKPSGKHDLLLEDNAYFLATFVNGEIVDLDGGHSTPEDVAHALALSKALGLHDQEEDYRMLQVSTVPKNTKQIDEGNARTIRETLAATGHIKEPGVE